LENKILSNRTTSGFPLSIGTSLAIESILEPISPVYDETRKVPKLDNLTSYAYIAFNTSTLLRNIISSIKYSEAVIVPNKDFYEVLLDEIGFLSNSLSLLGIDTRFYINTYDYVYNTYEKNNKLRKLHTEKQLYIDSILKYCLDRLRKDTEVDVFHKDIRYNKEDSVLIMTHIPFDLLSFSNFIKLDLLESHTGLLKTRKDWWSKYYPMPGDADMSFLPLLEYLLTVFGDHVMFSPDTLEKRKEVYKHMKDKKVNPLTTELSLSFLRQ